MRLMVKWNPALPSWWRSGRSIQTRFFFSSRRRHTRFKCDWSSDVCSSDLYGQTPIPARGDMGLRPAMTLKCAVAMVRSIKAGDGVSYGHTWIADRDTTVALLPIGYADGVFRNLSNRLEVWINGRRRPGVGRICMDQFVVDLGPGPVDVTEGDDAIVFGPGDDGEPTTQDWADLLGTINYEIVTSPRG